MPSISEKTRLLSNVKTLGNVRQELARLNLVLDAIVAGVQSTRITFPIDDETTIVYDHGNAAAKMRIDAGPISSGQTRVLTMPDQDIDLTPGTGTFAESATTSARLFMLMGA